MSKIYEALLRAEQDRAAATPAHPTDAIESRPDPIQPAPETAPWAHDPALDLGPTLDPALAATFTPTPPAATTEAAPRSQFATYLDKPLKVPEPYVRHDPSDAAFDPSLISRRRWVPSLAQLPAVDDRGKAVEQFRSLRSRMFEFRDLNRLKSIIVCSGLPKEGKSFVTANLAISFAHHLANRVLLIDGDMRRSTLHLLLGAPAEVGLSEYLAGTATLMDIMQRADQSDDAPPLPQGIASLTFIAAGSESDKAADLSGNRRFDELITKVSPFFDWIVVDSSPVNLVADGVNLARACDGVLLVARGGVTRFQSAQRALAELKASTILGFVLNAVEKPPQAGGYYGYEEYDSDRKEAELTAK